ncbi:MAG: type II toxin-antitoxin system PrlF family antitoxin [Magnetococcales bacterium]|nr:type II toxin-antitoxin system PrlF family antitoxin [Magnetococcales bacterium]
MLLETEITAKGQTIVPQNIRAALQVAAGDRITWQLNRDGTATVRRIQPLDSEYLESIEESLAEEWASSADEEAYRDL